MDTFCGLPVVSDDELFLRAAAVGLAFADARDAFDCLAEEAQDPCPSARVIRASDGRLAYQRLDHRTGDPVPPEWDRLVWEAIEYAREHRIAQQWLPKNFELLTPFLERLSVLANAPNY